MTETERFQRVRAAFERVIAEPPDKRPDTLDFLAMSDAALVHEVLALLDAHDRDAGPLDDDLPARVFLGATLDDDDMIGRRVGPYRLERELGRGGMGTVYEARREGADFEQRVAVKLIRFDAHTDSIVRRFRRERQILAALHHPNIATLMDGAVLSDGRPYLVMELVDGQPIDRFANAKRLTIRRRIELFLGVCDAVDHAHRNLIVHRDLKPRNVLVTGDGVPKLLDFGIAKLVHPDDGDTPTVTGAELRVFTPEYASPEQLRDDPIDTRSDVYSLGVILYQLLSGERPFGDAGRASGDIERILTTEPARPSAVVTDRAAADRGEPDAAALGRRLFGELDNVVLMALRKEPERRYSSVAQLADDLRRYLDGRAVLAQPDTAAYRMGKFLGRHRAGVIAASAIFLASIGGVAATLWQASLARAAAHRAQSERAKAEQVTAFLSNVLGAANPTWTTRGTRVGPRTTVLEALHDAATNASTELAAQPEVQATVLRTIGNTYRSLGMLDSAEPHLLRAVGLRRSAAPGASVEYARDLSALAALRHQQGHYDDAARLERQTVAMLRSLRDTSSADMAAGLNDLSVLERSDGNLPASDRASLEAIDLYRRLYGTNNPGLANALANRAAILMDRGDLDGAERSLREVFGIYDRNPQREFPERAVLLLNLASVRMWRGDYGAADSLAHASYDLFMNTVGEHNANTALALVRLAHSHHFEGRDSLALTEITRARAMLDADGMASDHPELSRVSTIEGMILTRLGKLPVADTMLRHALAIRVSSYKSDDTRRPETMTALGVALAAEGKMAEADSLLRLGHADMQRILGAGDPRTRWTAREEADALSRPSDRRSPCSTNGPAQLSCPGTPSARPD